MYDGHSDPKQFLMSYEATISSYGGNTAVMAKSFVMAVRSVAQTWYSSLRPGTITSWQKLKDMLITSFHGFQTKPVTAQALFQCTQDHEEYLQAYVRRFLRLRAQAPTVPNEIVIEVMIKGFGQDLQLSTLLGSLLKLWRSCSRRWTKAKGASRSCSATEPAEAGYAYCFVPFALHSRICRQSPCSLCCFGKSTPSILATASTATTNTTRSVARRESALSPPAGLQRGVRSSHSQ
jgi:hypothetical protein